MIIAHFFIRKVRKVPYLFVETTSSEGLEQPSPAAKQLMVLTGTDRKKWVRDAYYEFTKLYPDLVLLDTMKNNLRLESDHPAFDLVFTPKRLLKRRKRKPKQDEFLQQIEKLLLEYDESKDDS